MAKMHRIFRENTKMNFYLVIGDDFDLSMLENSNARVGSAKINSDSGSLRHFEAEKCGCVFTFHGKKKY